MKRNMAIYKKALRVAAEHAYKNEVVETDMERHIIGSRCEFESKEDWIEAKEEEWLEETAV